MSQAPIGFLGFGEAGFHLARGLRRAGAPPLVAFDIKADADGGDERIRARAAETETGLVKTPRELAKGAHVILSVVTAASARDAARSVAADLTPDHLYVDLNSVSPAAKQQIAAAIGDGAGRFVEGSIMAPVASADHRVPILLNGAWASDLVNALSSYGMRLETMDGKIGAAAAVKMCRSIVIKGLEALMVECTLASGEYGAADRVYASLAESYPGMDWRKTADYMIGRVLEHGERRAQEMEEVARTLRDAGVEPLMAEATARRQRHPHAGRSAARSFPRFGDVAHVGHVELFTPQPEASLDFFTSVVGLHETARCGKSVYLRAWGDYERHTLKLTAHETSGLGHLGLRVRDEETLQRLLAHLAAQNVVGTWVEDVGHGPAYRVTTPDGHAVELYWETERFKATPETATAFKNQPQRYVPRGIAPRRLDHINLLARDVTATRVFFQEHLGLRLTEQIVLDDASEAGAWLSATNKSYDVAITRDRTGASGRFHHLTFMMDSREDVLRAADILRDADVTIETGPHKHNIGQTFFLYCFEPGGNRFEIGAGGYLIFDPDWKPIVWTQAERAKGQAWGLQTVSSFHTRGTPPVPGFD